MTTWSTGQHKMSYLSRYGWQNLEGHSVARFNSFLCQRFKIIPAAHLNGFIVLCNGVESGFMAYACTSPPVWLGTTELTNFPVNLTPGPGRCLLQVRTTWRPAWPRTSALKRSMLMLGPATSWQPGGQGLLLVLRLVTNLPCPSQPEVPKQYTYTATIICLASMLVVY